MKKLLHFGIISFLLIACGGVKKTQEALNTGNYGNAINKSILNLVDNKTKKSNQPYVLLLEEAFKKNTERELQNIAFLEKDGNPANYETIFQTYNNLKSIQERIQPLLPLPIYEENRDAQFSFKKYDEKLLASKGKLSDYLYDNASNLLDNASNKQDFRQAFDDFKYLLEINPGYGDAKQKMETAYDKGLDYVKVAMVNHTEQIVPAKLEEELLNFNTYGLDELWTRYHTNPLPNINYDYAMQVALRQINISPEQVSEKQIIKERQVKDGYQYAIDNNGNVVRDSLGNDIKIDKFTTVRCNFYQFTQFKTAQVTGVVSFTDLDTRQEIGSYPLSSEFVFEHVYANYNGDKRALDNDLVAMLNLAAVPFPSNEQMVYDAGEDLKSRLKNILVSQRFN
jgi:tetratricopeptide (TPR) repeat protein